MQPQYLSHFQLPTHSDVPADTQYAVIEARLSALQQEGSRARDQAKQMALIAQEYRDSVKKLLGADKYRRLRAYGEEQKRRKTTLLPPPEDSTRATEESDQLRSESREQSLRFLNQLGINQTDLRELATRARTRWEQFGPSLPLRDGKPVTILLPSQVPEDIRAYKTNPWTVARPPYHPDWWYNGSVAGFKFFPTLHQNAGNGLIGNRNDLQDSNATDNDYGYVMYSTSVLFWYYMASPGLVEVWIEARSDWSHHYVSLFDEYGWSDSSVLQHNYITLRATVGGSTSELQRAITTGLTLKHHTDGYWHKDLIPDGETYWFNLVSDPHVIIPAGSWVLVDVGTLNWNSTFANDVAVYSTLDFAWTIQSVTVRSTGE